MKVLFSRFLLALLLISFSEYGSAQELISEGRDRESEITNLAENPGFELDSVSPDPTGRNWALKSGDRAPDGWNLSPAFPGELEIIESSAPEGERFIRVTAVSQSSGGVYWRASSGACSSCKCGGR